jgi:hypothetical protein
LAGRLPPPEMFVEELSPEGKELLDRLQRGKLTADEYVEEMLRLSLKDQDVLLKIHKHLAQAYELEVEHHTEGYRQTQLARSVFLRASELEPGSIRDDTPLREAIRVLERYGEKPPEDLDLARIGEVPEEE